MTNYILVNTAIGELTNTYHIFDDLGSFDNNLFFKQDSVIKVCGCRLFHILEEAEAVAKSSNETTINIYQVELLDEDPQYFRVVNGVRCLIKVNKQLT